MQLLLNANASPDLATPSGDVAVVSAAKSMTVEAIILLIHAKADLHQQDGQGNDTIKTCFDLPWQERHQHVGKQLIPVLLAACPPSSLQHCATSHLYPHAPYTLSLPMHAFDAMCTEGGLFYDDDSLLLAPGVFGFDSFEKPIVIEYDNVEFKFPSLRFTKPNDNGYTRLDAVKVLGEGGFGTVVLYRVQDSENHHYAVKNENDSCVVLS